MTRILLLLDRQHFFYSAIDDPRPVRELVMAINTGQLWVGEPALRATRQYAFGHPSVNVVTVQLDAPPVTLTPRHYQVLYRLADGQTLEQIGQALGISTRTARRYLEELKERFQAATRAALLKRALEIGWL